MATFYCESSASGGGDGSLSTPWNTFASIAWGSVSSGDTINFSGSFTESLIVARNGVTLAGKYSGVTTIIDAVGLDVGIECETRTGVLIKGFNVKNSEKQNIDMLGSNDCHVHSCQTSNALWDDIRIRHSIGCSIKFCSSIGARFRGMSLSTASVGQGMSDCLIENCIVLDAATRGYTMSGDPVTHPIKSSTIRNCISQGSLEGLQVNYAEDNCLLIDLKLLDNTDTGIYEVSNVSSTVFKNIDIVGGSASSINNIQNVTDVTFDGIKTRAAASNGFKFLANSSVTRVTIQNCEITGASNNAVYGIYTDSGMTIDELVINNNLLYGNDLMIRLHSNWLNSSITNNTFAFTGVTGSVRDAISIRTDQTNDLVISKNVFEGIEGQCIDEVSQFAQNLTTSQNYYGGLQVGNLVTVNGTSYSETTITTFEPTRILYRDDAFGYVAPTSVAPRAVTYISEREAASTSSGFTIQPSKELEVFAEPRLAANEFVTIEVNDVSLGWRTMGAIINSDDTSGFIKNNKRVAQEYRVTKSTTQAPTRIESN
tara:strand:- start:1608 stop:3230 length:1623 start_codon:yes stop_codon:yes gene_type:complete